MNSLGSIQLPTKASQSFWRQSGGITAEHAPASMEWQGNINQIHLKARCLKPKMRPKPESEFTTSPKPELIEQRMGGCPKLAEGSQKIFQFSN
jgi:hypothetical protein